MLNSVGIAHLGARIILSYGLKTVLSFLKDTEKIDEVPGISSPYDTTNYEVMFHLVSHTEQMVAEELYQYVLVCCELIISLNSKLIFSYVADRCFLNFVAGAAFSVFLWGSIRGPVPSGRFDFEARLPNGEQCPCYYRTLSYR